MEAKSKSAIEKYFSCQKSYEYAYVDGFEPKGTSLEQRFGIAGHAILEADFKGVGPDWGALDLDNTNKSKLGLLIAAWRKSVGVPAGVRHVEHAWNTGSAKGVFDAVIVPKELTEPVEVWEHKFTKSLLESDNYWGKFRFEWQVGLYQVAARKLFPGRDVVVVLNALRVPQLIQGKKEGTFDYLERIREHIAANPGAYFQRARIKWSDAALRTVALETLKLAENIPNQSYFPRSRRCMEWNRLCGYYPVCFEDKPLTDQTLYQLRSKRA